MSRQMAFQLTEYRYREVLKKVTALYDLKEEGMGIKEWAEAVEPDERKRQEMLAVILISVKLHNEGKDPTKVRKLVVWRGPDGAPKDVEAEIDNVRVRG